MNFFIGFLATLLGLLARVGMRFLGILAFIGTMVLLIFLGAPPPARRTKMSR